MAVTEAYSDAVGPDGSVWLRCYLPMRDSVWFRAHCSGPAGCSHAAPLGIRAAIRFMGTAEATLWELERRLRCNQCGGRWMSVVVSPNTRPPMVRERDGPAPQTRAGLPEGDPSAG